MHTDARPGFDADPHDSHPRDGSPLERIRQNNDHDDEGAQFGGEPAARADESGTERAPGALQDLHCVCRPIAGVQWTAHVAVYDEGEQLVICRRMGDTFRSDRVPHVGEIWRELASVLAHSDASAALPEYAARDVLPAVQSDSDASRPEPLPPWLDALYCLCWVRDDEEQGFSPGAILCELPETWLQGLGRRYDLADIRRNRQACALIAVLRRLHRLARTLGAPAATLLLRASAESDLQDDPNGFRRALGRVFWNARQTLRTTARGAQSPSPGSRQRA